MSERMTAAKAMVKCLEHEGISKIFGYPGAAICPFYDELIDSKIKHILVRHEANAGHAASGYARITGRAGVAVATSGPGATNLITAIATAYMDSIPLVIITGQVSSELIGRDVFQEADITGAAEPFVKHSYLVKNADEIPQIFKRAFYIANTGRPGPVLIDIPIDVQKTEIDFEYPKSVEIRSYKPSTKGNTLQLKRVAEALNKAEKPLICAGGGVFSAKALDGLKRLSESAEIPVVTTMMGISALPTGHRLYFGMIGMHGVHAAKKAISKCDLLILIGARVGDRAVTPAKSLGDVTVIHIDIDPAEIGKNIPATIPLVGDAGLILEQLLEKIEIKKHGKWIEYLEGKRRDAEIKAVKEGFVNPRQFITLLNKYLPEQSVVVADVGQNQIWTANYIAQKKGRFLTSGGMGTMGYSIPAAIGAKLASGGSEVIAICGDGSFQMQFMELATIIQHNVNVKIIIMKNNRLGMVRELQSNLYENRQTAVFLDGSPDFIKIAQAYGITAERVDDITKADEILKSFIGADKPYLLEVTVEEEEKTL